MTTVEVRDNTMGGSYAGPYVVTPNKDAVYLHTDPMPDDVRVAVDMLLAVLRVAGPIVRAHFGGEQVLLVPVQR